MNLMTLWHSLRGNRADANAPATAVASPAADLIAQARAHQRAGRAAEASELYWKLKSKHLTPESLVEHAELLLELGDHFSAASKAARALEFEPANARASAVQREVTRREEAEERRRK